MLPFSRLAHKVSGKNWCLFRCKLNVAAAFLLPHRGEGQILTTEILKDKNISQHRELDYLASESNNFFCKAQIQCHSCNHKVKNIICHVDMKEY